MSKMSQTKEELKTELENFRESIKELKGNYEETASRMELVSIQLIIEDLEELLK